MKRSCKFLTIMALTTLLMSTGNAKDLIINVNNIRNNKGKVLVMANIPGVKEPLYQMVDAKEGEVIIELKNINSEEVELSLFHDENGNYEMDMGERGPLEGYLTKKWKLSNDSTQIKLKVYYPNVNIQ